MTPSKSGLIVGVTPHKGMNPGPQQPSLILNDPHMRPQTFPDLRAMARFLQRLRTEGGVQRGLQLRPTLATWRNSDSFPAFEVLVQHDPANATGEGEHIATIACQGASLERMRMLLAEADHTAPRDARMAA